MKTFEVAVPLKYCKNVRIEPSYELGEPMIVYKFSLDEVYLRKITKDIRANVLDEFGGEVKKFRCRECGAKEGELHKEGCLREFCSKCGKQRVLCKCNAPKEPYIHVHGNCVCYRCGELYPKFFNVPDKEWNQLPSYLRDYILCLTCYKKIRKLLKLSKTKLIRGFMNE